MIVQPIPSGPLETNAYLLICEETKVAALMDPALESGKIFLKAIEEKQLKPDKILLTHSHWDHIADCAFLKKTLQIPIFVHKKDAENLEHPGSDQLPMLFPVEGVKPDKFLEDKEVVSIGNVHLLVIHTPGHSPGSVSFYCEKEKTLFSGDTLFKGSCGNTSFPTSSNEDMKASLKKLKQFPPDTKVFSGHGPMTTIEEEGWIDQIEKILN